LVEGQFFVTSLKNERMYLMKQVGEVMLSRSLDEMPFFYKHEDHQRFIAGRQMLLGEYNKELDSNKTSWTKGVHYDEYLDDINTKATYLFFTPE
jgi:hypothetical protein